MTEARPVLGVVMDPIESIKPKKDSTLAMMLAYSGLLTMVAVATARRSARGAMSRSATTPASGSR